jgi:predicted transcriptional regulator
MIKVMATPEGRPAMQRKAIVNARQELHQIIDSLAEDQIVEVRQYIEELRGEEAPTDEALAAIREGLEDIQHGRVMDVQEYRRTRGM